MINESALEGPAGRRGDLIRIAALATAVLLVLAPMPAVLELPAAWLLLVVPGGALKRLMLGADGRHPALDLPLTALLGLLFWLAAALALHVVEISLTTTSLASVVGVSTTVLLCAARVGSLRRRDAETGPVPTRAPEGRTGSSVRRWAGIAASAVVLVASVALARELVPVPAERFTLLAFVDSKPFSATVNAVAPRARVRLNWVLRAYGAELATGLTTVAVRMDGRPVEQVAVDLEPVTPSDGERGTAELKGAVTVTAPVRPGRHSVQLVVTPSNPDGTDLPPPGPVTTDLEVRR